MLSFKLRAKPAEHKGKGKAFLKAAAHARQYLLLYCGPLLFFKIFAFPAKARRTALAAS